MLADPLGNPPKEFLDVTPDFLELALEIPAATLSLAAAFVRLFFFCPLRLAHLRNQRSKDDED